MTPRLRAVAHVEAAWKGCYSQMFGSAVDSEARALRYESALRDIASASTCAGTRSMARAAIALAGNDTEKANV